MTCDQRGRTGRKVIPTSRTSARRRCGFTLLEIILVVAITLIVSALAVPSFVRSYRAANLRTASRGVVTACKYARNMAVLRQQQMTVFFNSTNGEIQIVAVERGAGPRIDAFLDGRMDRGGEEDFSPRVQRTHQLPEEVRIVDFSSPGGLQEMDGIYWVNYFPSGVSDSFAIRIEDLRSQRSVRVEVDQLSGTTTETFSH